MKYQPIAMSFPNIIWKLETRYLQHLCIIIPLILAFNLPCNAQITPDFSGSLGSSSTNNYMSTTSDSDGNFYAAWKYRDSVFVGKWNGSTWTTASTNSISLLGSSTWGFNDDISLAIDNSGTYHIAMRATNNNVSCCAQPRGVVYATYDGSWSGALIETYSHPNGFLGADNPEIALDPSGNPEITWEFKITK